MKLLTICAIFVSYNSWAGRIVPEISWKQNSINNTGAAAAIYGVDNISGSYLFGDTENTKDSDYESKFEQVALGGRTSFNQTVIEAYTSDKQTKTNGSNFNNGFLFTSVGHELENDLYIGGEFTHDKSKTREYNSFAASIVKRLDSDLLIGGGFERETLNHLDLKRNILSFGGGRVDGQNSAHEIYLRYSPQAEEKVDGFYNYSYEFLGIYTRSTIHIDQWEILGGVQATNSWAEISSDNIDRELTFRNLYLRAEYLVSSQFALVGGVNFSQREFKNNEDSDDNFERELFSYNFGARLKHGLWQASATIFIAEEEYDYDSSGSEDDANYKQDTVFIGLTRFI